MSDRVYTVITTMEAKPGKEEQLKEQLLRLRAPSLEEPGCMSYYIYHSADEPQKFMLFQNWINSEAQVVHSASEHVAEWKKNSLQLLVAPYISTFWTIIK